ncbi:putative nucleic acid-binding protein [Mycoplana sp. BE70]|nr:putative nucleic acid-binding protein [Mycoplana sp. BE70]
MARRIYVDSNIFIYLLDGSDDLRQRTLAKLAAIFHVIKRGECDTLTLQFQDILTLRLHDMWQPG